MTDVLLIEPNKLLADTYAQAFAKVGLRCVWRASAQAAVNYIDTNTPKVVVLEVQLGSHNGIEFLYEFRSHADWNNIPVIILSVVPQQELGLTAAIMQKLGVEAYFYKPQATLQQITTAARTLAKPHL